MAVQQPVENKRKPRRASVGQGWRTTDADEIERRRRRAEAEKPQVLRAETGSAFFAAYMVQSQGRPAHRVEFRSLEQAINSCDCPDYEVNGLGTCKHIEAVRQHLQNKRAPARRSRTEVYLDRSDQYGQGPRIWVQWADRLADDSPVRQTLAPFFPPTMFCSAKRRTPSRHCSAR